jgi:nicotinate-nucleotide--dimethylbenzimidazole phosphoribosyltransferase
MSHAWWCEPCQPLDQLARARAAARQQQLTKPSGSLGALEHLAIQLAALQGRVNPCVDKLTICVFAADHGVVAEGVSAYPQAVTGQMLHNFVNGGAAISVLARQLGATLEVINLGTAVPLGPLPGVRHARLGAGSANLMHTAAMTQGQLEAALQVGRDAVLRAVQQGQQCRQRPGGSLARVSRGRTGGAGDRAGSGWAGAQNPGDRRRIGFAPAGTWSALAGSALSGWL